jgi:hypothetical protein
MNKFVITDLIRIEQMIDMHHHSIVSAEWETLHIKHSKDTEHKLLTPTPAERIIKIPGYICSFKIITTLKTLELKNVM